MSSINLSLKTKEYSEKGFTVFKAHDLGEQTILNNFAQNWIYRLLGDWVQEKREEMPLHEYHIWSQKFPPEHRQVFGARNRYQYPPPEVRNALISPTMKEFLTQVGVTEYKVWDDGWGDVGFRLVRPGVGDGYPLCAKDWGVAKGVVSFWVPIIGLSDRETLTLVPGSHLRDYPKKVAEDKFAAGEPRFAGSPDSIQCERPKLSAGEVICYHPKTLHSEEVKSSPITRLNLEIRFQPLSASRT